MKKFNNKRAISLIVLVITIIVMIVLASAIILSLSSSGIIGRANEAKTKSDMANIEEMANTIKTEAMLECQQKSEVLSQQKLIEMLQSKFEGSVREADAIVVDHKYDIMVDSDLKIKVVKSRLYGDGQTFNTLVPSYLTFKSYAKFDDFKEVKVNGQTIDASNYTLEEGSIIVKLNIDYLKTLGTGLHEVTVVSKTSSRSANFSVVKPEVNSQGFYYSQPYTAHISFNYKINGSSTVYTVDKTVMFMLHENGSANLLSDGIGAPMTFSVAQDVYTFNISGVDFSGSFVENGTAFRCSSATYQYDRWSPKVSLDNIEFCLGKDGAAYGDFIYFYDEYNGGNAIFPIDSTKLSYGTILENVNNQKTVSIATRAFDGNSQIVSIGPVGSGASLEIPNSVTTIRGSAFKNCTSLTNVELPYGVTNIADSAFANCSNLASVEIPNSVTSIAETAFMGCSGLTDIEIPGSVTNIPRTLFRGLKGLTRVVIGDGVTSIGYETFARCSNLASVEIPDSMINIGDSAFVDCSSLTDIEIPDSVTTIGISVFKNCTSLTSVVIPDSMTSISSSMFMGCSSLTDIQIPDSVTSIGLSAFRECSSLSRIVIPDSVVEFKGWTFTDCPNLTSITFEGTVAQWSSINKGENWNKNVPATEVICSDGTVSLK